ncbi:voltage-dependent anion channel [Mycena metata]|uniref:Voltage-dependent anion channel n=1 Tax=Mycena metata TaxID=1033252 RepID=A0AAD7IMB5_9AGAR|nr:voltage-dependent anion channel [Mycena metata]
MSSRKDLKTCIRHFTWSWHTVVMGTGVVSSLISRFHFGQGSEALKILTLLTFFLNLFFFVAICAATVARYCMFPELWSAMLRHPTQSLFTGCSMMGAATLLNSGLAAHQSYSFAGPGFLYTLWAFWWLDSVGSAFTAVGMIYVMMTKHRHSLGQMSALWLLPVVTLIVASSTGGLLSTALAAAGRTSDATLTMGVSFTMVLIGLSLALMIITVYLMRLVIHGPLNASLILSSFIILGPLGQGGFSMLVNSQNLANTPLPPSLSVTAIQAVCFCVAWALWSMGLVWLCIAVSSICNVLHRQSAPFSIGYWGMIFPNGVFALLTVELGVVLESPVLNYLGAIFSVLVFLLWTFVFLKTIPAVYDTSIFNSPCASKLDEQTRSSLEGS